jgi:hypothetical protein
LTTQKFHKPVPRKADTMGRISELAILMNGLLQRRL